MLPKSKAMKKYFTLFSVQIADNWAICYASKCNVCLSMNDGTSYFRHHCPGVSNHLLPGRHIFFYVLIFSLICRRLRYKTPRINFRYTLHILYHYCYFAIIIYIIIIITIIIFSPKERLSCTELRRSLSEERRQLMVY